MRFLIHLAPLALLAGVRLPNLGSWEAIGPEGGVVSSLAVDPVNTNILYAGTPSGVFKSENGGKTWSARSLRTEITALVINPHDPQILYAGAYRGGVYKTTDGGENWTASHQGLPGLKVAVLAIDPQFSTTIYAGLSIAGGVYKSEDAGRSWMLTGSGLPGSPVSLSIDPKRPWVLYASTDDSGTPGRGVFKTTDGAKSWRSAGQGLPPQQSAFSLVVNPRNPDIVLAGVSSSGVFKSIDQGEHWREANEGLPENSTVRSLTVDPRDGRAIFAALGSRGVFKSIDEAETWRRASEGIPVGTTSTELAIDPKTPDTVYVCTSSNGVYKSTNAAESWSPANIGLYTTHIQSIAIDPWEPETLYASTIVLPGTGPKEVFKSIDGGTSWSLSLRFAAAGPYVSLLTSRGFPNTVYAAGSRFYRSRDGGRTWEVRVSGLPPIYLLALAAHPSNPRIIYVGSSRGRLFMTKNEGESWFQVSVDLPERDILAIVVDPAEPATLYVGLAPPSATSLPHCVYKSTDGGRHWVGSGQGLPDSYMRALVVDPGNSRTLYAGTTFCELGLTVRFGVCIRARDFQESGVFKTTDGGREWHRVSPAFGVQALALDPSDPATLYAGTTTLGVYKTTDGGKSWRPVIPRPLGEDLSIRSLAIDPLNPSTVYAGTSGTGILKTRTGGEGSLP